MPVFSDAKDKNATRNFLAWIEANQDGFFINRKGARDMTLHSSRCGHLKPYDWANQTTNLKACSRDRRKLEHWADVEGIEELEVCSDCI